MALGDNDDKMAAIAAENADLDRASNDGVDTIDERGSERRERPDGDAGDEQQPRELVRGSKYDQKRTSIYEKAKQLRADEQVKIDEAVIDINDRLDDRAPPASDEPRKLKLKVNREEIELSEEDVIAHAQQSLAAGPLLEQAKRDRAEAQTLLDTLRRERANPPAPEAVKPTSEQKKAPTTAASDTPPTPADDDPDMDDIVDRIQVGDPKQAREALQKYGDRIIEQVVARIGNLDERIVDTMETVTENTARQTATREVLESFAKENPEFKSARLQPALATASLEIMEENMRTAGVSNEALDGFINGRKLTRAEGIGAAYRHLLEMDGNKFKLPTHDVVLNSAADVIRKDLNLPSRRPTTPAPASVDASQRVERKERIALQPRRANAPLQGDRRELSREERAKAAVQQMRASRGRRMG